MAQRRRRRVGPAGGSASAGGRGRPRGAGAGAGHALWQRAASFAAEKHQHQFRKDGRTPYAAHPFRVAMTVRHVFACDDGVALAAALLHDLIEDTTVDWDDLAERFGRPVADCVASLTKNASLPEAQREAEYDRRLAAAGWRAQLVKLADCYDNLSEAEGPAAAAKVRRKCRRALAIAAGSGDGRVRLAAARLRALMGAGGRPG